MGLEENREERGEEGSEKMPQAKNLKIMAVRADQSEFRAAR